MCEYSALFSNDKTGVVMWSQIVFFTCVDEFYTLANFFIVKFYFLNNLTTFAKSLVKICIFDYGQDDNRRGRCLQ